MTIQVGETKSFTALNDAKMFQAVTSGFYKNPILAIVRELFANAVDVHNQVGTKRPIDIAIPTKDNPTFVIRDYGTGLTYEQIAGIFTVFGATTKTENDIGGFGLGAKTPFAKVEQFMVRSFVDGEVSLYNCHISNDEPMCGKMLIESTTEDKGVEIIIPCVVEEVDEWRKALATVTALFYDNMPNIYGYEVGENGFFTGGGSQTVLTDHFNIKDNLIHSGEHVTYFKNQTFMDISKEKVFLSVKGVLYPLQQSYILDLVSEFQQKLTGKPELIETYRSFVSERTGFYMQNVVVKCDNLELMRSREGFLYNDFNANLISDAIIAAHNELVGFIKSTISKYTDNEKVAQYIFNNPNSVLLSKNLNDSWLSGLGGCPDGLPITLDTDLVLVWVEGVRGGKFGKPSNKIHLRNIDTFHFSGDLGVPEDSFKSAIASQSTRTQMIVQLPVTDTYKALTEIDRVKLIKEKFFALLGVKDSRPFFKFKEYTSQDIGTLFVPFVGKIWTFSKNGTIGDTNTINTKNDFATLFANDDVDCGNTVIVDPGMHLTRKDIINFSALAKGFSVNIIVMLGGGDINRFGLSNVLYFKDVFSLLGHLGEKKFDFSLLKIEEVEFFALSFASLYTSNLTKLTSGYNTLFIMIFLKLFNLPRLENGYSSKWNRWDVSLFDDEKIKVCLLSALDIGDKLDVEVEKLKDFLLKNPAFKHIKPERDIELTYTLGIFD